MNRKSIAFGMLLVALLCVQPAWADYVNPPGWEDNPYFTHQSWDFNETDWEGEPPEPTPPTQPLAPDGGVENLYGTPQATWYEHEGGMFGWNYNIMGQPDISGRTGFIGGMTGGWLSFEVPNEFNPDLVKELWLQYIYLGPIHEELSGSNASAEVTADGSTAGLVSIIEDVDLGPGGTSGTYHWYRRTELWEITPQPDSETVTITLAPGVGMVDEVDIDTRCVPEPVTMAVLGLGAVVLLGRRRRS